MAGSKEKRKKVRIPFIYGIEYDDADDAVVIGDGTGQNANTKIILKDISQDGIQIASAKPLEQGREIKIFLRFPRWRGVPRNVMVGEKSCRVSAVVRWVAKKPSEKYYRMGLGFVNLSQNDRQLVDQYLEENIVADEDLLT